MKLPKNTCQEEAYPVMCITNEYLWRDYILSAEPNLQFSLQSLMEKDGRYYDILSFTDPSQDKELCFFFDVSAFFGKPGIILPQGDLPMPARAFLLPEIFGEAGQSMIDLAREVGIDCSTSTVTFKPYSSKMVSQYVAIWYHHNNNFDVTPIRDYTKPFGVPVLHGFRFWRLMFLHQFQHVLNWHDVASTEVEVKGNYYKPTPGIDCIAFTELPPFSFANDLLNHTFYTHKPQAFNATEELNALGTTLYHGFAKGLFTYEEILFAIRSARLEQPNEDALVNLTKKVYDRMAASNDPSSSFGLFTRMLSM